MVTTLTTTAVQMLIFVVLHVHVRISECKAKSWLQIDNFRYFQRVGICGTIRTFMSTEKRSGEGDEREGRDRGANRKPVALSLFLYRTQNVRNGW